MTDRLALREALVSKNVHLNTIFDIIKIFFIKAPSGEISGSSRRFPLKLTGTDRQAAAPVSIGMHLRIQNFGYFFKL